MRSFGLDEFRAIMSTFDGILLLTPEAEIKAAVERWIANPENLVFDEEFRRSLPEEWRIAIDGLTPEELQEGNEIIAEVETRKVCFLMATRWTTLLLKVWNDYGGRTDEMAHIDPETLLPNVHESFLEKYRQDQDIMLGDLKGSFISEADVIVLIAKFTENLRQKLAAEHEIGIVGELKLMLTDSGEYMLVPRTTKP